MYPYSDLKNEGSLDHILDERMADGIRRKREGEVMRNTGNGFWVHLATERTGQKVRRVVSKEVPDSGSGPNLGPFFPNSVGYLPVASTFPGNGENHGIMRIT